MALYYKTALGCQFIVVLVSVKFLTLYCLIVRFNSYMLIIHTRYPHVNVNILTLEGCKRHRRKFDAMKRRLVVR